MQLLDAATGRLQRSCPCPAGKARVVIVWQSRRRGIQSRRWERSSHFGQGECGSDARMLDCAKEARGHRTFTAKVKFVTAVAAH